MKIPHAPKNKIYNLESIKSQVDSWKANGNKIAFTNGVFDILHTGHLMLLYKSCLLADVLIIGINSDASVKRLKGESRPINNEASRLLMLSCLGMTDGVILFEEDTPYELIQLIQPDILIKGGDYSQDTIVGAELVKASGGQVVVIEFEEGFSTTGTIAKIKNQ